MVSDRCSNDFLQVSFGVPVFSRQVFPMIFARHPYGFHKICTWYTLGFPAVFNRPSYVFCQTFSGFPKVIQYFSYGCRGVFICCIATPPPRNATTLSCFANSLARKNATKITQKFKIEPIRLQDAAFSWKRETMVSAACVKCMWAFSSCSRLYICEWRAGAATCS